MVNHNIEQLQLSENDTGEMSIPSESQTLTLCASVRQFMIQAQRNYSPVVMEVLSDKVGLNLRVNQTVDCDLEEIPTLVAITLLVKPEGDMEEFVEREGDIFYDRLLSILSTCDSRGVNGQRGVFLGELRRKVLNFGMEVFETKVLLSTSVFYNDYRVTVGYPYTKDEVEMVTESIYNRLLQDFPDMKFEVSGELCKEVTDDIPVFA